MQCSPVWRWSKLDAGRQAGRQTDRPKDTRNTISQPSVVAHETGENHLTTTHGPWRERCDSSAPRGTARSTAAPATGCVLRCTMDVIAVSRFVVMSRRRRFDPHRPCLTLPVTRRASRFARVPNMKPSPTPTPNSLTTTNTTTTAAATILPPPRRLCVPSQRQASTQTSPPPPLTPSLSAGIADRRRNLTNAPISPPSPFEPTSTASRVAQQPSAP